MVKLCSQPKAERHFFLLRCLLEYRDMNDVRAFFFSLPTILFLASRGERKDDHKSRLTGFPEGERGHSARLSGASFCFALPEYFILAGPALHRSKLSGDRHHVWSWGGVGYL